MTRLHPFTPMALTMAVVLASLALGTWQELLVLHGVVAMGVAGAGQWRLVRRATAALTVPWALLVVVHVLLRGGGWPTVLGMGARLGAISTATVALLAAFDSARFVDAAAAARWPFWLTYLVAATLQAPPRLLARAMQIRDAQRVRGLSASGSVRARLRALVPLAVPLALGVLIEVDERAMALESRGIRTGRRTPLRPVPASALDLACWIAAGIASVVSCWVALAR